MSRNLAETAALLSDPGRASMMIALLGGVTLPAGQLAMIANVAPQTASSHLRRLISGKLVVVEQQGRHRYYCLAGSEVAHAIEALLAVAPQKQEAFTKVSTDRNISFARTCYSHLAGRVAVQIVDALEKRGFLGPSEPRLYSVSQRGRAWFEDFGISFSDSQVKHASFARRCLDWTERRPHLAGILGAAVLQRFRELKWIAPLRGTRAVRVTLQGQAGLEKLLRLRFTNSGIA